MLSNTLWVYNDSTTFTVWHLFPFFRMTAWVLHPAPLSLVEAPRVRCETVSSWQLKPFFTGEICLLVWRLEHGWNTRGRESFRGNCLTTSRITRPRIWWWRPWQHGEGSYTLESLRDNIGLVDCNRDLWTTTRKRCSARAWTSVILAGKRCSCRHLTTNFSET